MTSVDELTIYPVKSMAGCGAAMLDIESRGPVGDRRWMVVDEQMRFVTGRVVPMLARCSVDLTESGITLEFEQQQLDVPIPDKDAARCSVVVWRDTCAASDAGQAAADWLTAKFGRALRLVYQTDADHRRLAPAKAYREGDEVSFADGYPLLLTTTASLADLNTRLQSPVSMHNFRPNIVVATHEPYVEDSWREIRIGDVTFAVASCCSRCIFTTVDPVTGIRRADGEPLRTLRGYRRDEDSGHVMFGVNLIPLGSGTLRRGAEVRILS